MFIMKVPGEHIDTEETFAMNATVLVVLIVVVLVVVLPDPSIKNIEVVHHNQVKKLQSNMMWNRRH